MRAIGPAQILLFLILLGLILLFGIGSTLLTVGALALGDFRGIAVVAAAVVAIYLYAFLVYRLFLLCMPLAEGVLEPGSSGEFVANVNILFYLLLFNSLIRTHFLPVPVLRLVYLALGARLGANTYSAGVILDPPLTRIGANTIVGHDAVIVAHVIEGSKLELKPVWIGDNVTIGATAIVMAGTRIGDGAIVSAGAVVTKDTLIGAGEVWGGMPARLLKGATGGQAQRNAGG
jgi:acetyltransferase-like isoleucine patch superfamily enzyme